MMEMNSAKELGKKIELQCWHVTLENSTGSDIGLLNADGGFIWVKGFPGYGSDLGHAIVTDSEGAIYTTGEFTGEFDGDPGPDTVSLVTGTNGSIFISKLDANGDYQWAHNFGSGVGYDAGFDIFVDNNSDVFLTGLIEDNANFNDNIGNGVQLNSNGNWDAYVVKLDQQGPDGLENFPALSVRAFPNPVKNSFTVETGISSGNVKVEISDVAGRLIYAGIYPAANCFINDFNPKSGIYFLSIISGNDKKIVKVIKE